MIKSIILKIKEVIEIYKLCLVDKFFRLNCRCKYKKPLKNIFKFESKLYDTTKFMNEFVFEK